MIIKDAHGKAVVTQVVLAQFCDKPLLISKD